MTRHSRPVQLLLMCVSILLFAVGFAVLADVSFWQRVLGCTLVYMAARVGVEGWPQP